MDSLRNAPVTIDVNGDLGEGFGPYVVSSDEALLKCVTSANIACGFHAGDPGTMRKTVRMALEQGVAIGAHPGLPDRVGFGRRGMEITPDEAYEMVLYQIGALDGFARAEGGRLSHVKPHGALYTMAAQDAPLARAIVEAIAAYNSGLALFGLSGSALTRAGEAVGLTTAHEVFADRRYMTDGQLAPRRTPGAVITDMGEALDQVMGLVLKGCVTAVNGDRIPLRADTLCIHGDTSHAVQFARSICERLRREGVRIQSIEQKALPDSSG